MCKIANALSRSFCRLIRKYVLMSLAVCKIPFSRCRCNEQSGENSPRSETLAQLLRTNSHSFLLFSRYFVKKALAIFWKRFLLVFWEISRDSPGPAMMKLCIYAFTVSVCGPDKCLRGRRHGTVEPSPRYTPGIHNQTMLCWPRLVGQGNT